MKAIQVDLLGFGSSPKPADATYDVACHLRSLSPHVPDGSVVVGHSAGAILASALAASRSEEIASLVLLGAPAFPDEATARQEIDRLGVLARITVHHAWVGSAMCETMCALRPLLVPIAPRLASDIPAEVATDFLHHSWASYSRTLRRVVIEHRLAPDLVATRCPVTLLGGVDDRDAPLRWQAALVEELAANQIATRLIEVPGGHHTALREPKVVARVLVGVLDRVRFKATGSQ